MSWLEKMSEKLGIIEEEEYDDEQDEGKKNFPPVKSNKFGQEEKQDADILSKYAAQEKEERTKRSPLDFTSLHINQNEVERTAREKKNISSQNIEKHDLKTVTALAEALHVVIVDPTEFDDSQKIADILRQGQSVIINFEDTDVVLSKRISDFISGVVYALGGTMQMVGRSILLCAPSNIGITAAGK